MLIESTSDQDNASLEPSFLQKILELRAENASREEVGILDPFRSKLLNYEYAESHGIRPPNIIEVWESIDSVRLEGMPSKFALKSDEGHSGNGVMLLERLNADTFGVIGTHKTLTASGVRQFFHGKSRRGHTGGPLFAESLLPPERADRRPTQIPDDIKIYTANGRVLQVLIRSAERLRDPSSVTWNYFSVAGEGIGSMVHGKQIDKHIRRPALWSDLIEAARHLSRGAGTAFMRVDLYSDGQSIFFGELTPSPGGGQQYARTHDATMGRLWSDSELELCEDIAKGRPVGILYGNKPWKSRFPSGHRPDDGHSELPRVYTSTCRSCIGQNDPGPRK